MSYLEEKTTAVVKAGSRDSTEGPRWGEVRVSQCENKWCNPTTTFIIYSWGKNDFPETVSWPNNRETQRDRDTERDTKRESQSRLAS